MTIPTNALSVLRLWSANLSINWTQDHQFQAIEQVVNQTPLSGSRVTTSAAPNKEQFKETNKKKDYREDPDDLFFQAGIQRTQYDSIILVNNCEYFGTVNAIKGPKHQLAIKVAFITIPQWKLYVQLHFKVCTGSAALESEYCFKDDWRVTFYHKALLCLGKNVVHCIDVREMTGAEGNIPNLESEKTLHRGISQKLVYELTIEFKPKRMRHCGFVFGCDKYPILNEVWELISSACVTDSNLIRLVVNTNQHVTSVVTDFLKCLQDDVPDYSRFYPCHPTKHFLQVGDYAKADERPLVNVSALPMLDSWSEYTTVYGYRAIYKHKIALNKCTRLRGMVFNLRVMNVSGLAEKWYIGFVENDNKNDVCVKVGDVLKVNFNPEEQVETKN